MLLERKSKFFIEPIKVVYAALKSPRPSRARKPAIGGSLWLFNSDWLFNSASAAQSFSYSALDQLLFLFVLSIQLLCFNRIQLLCFLNAAVVGMSLNTGSTRFRNWQTNAPYVNCDPSISYSPFALPKAEFRANSRVLLGPAAFPSSFAQSGC
jgi:hypothetical protein